MPALSQADYEAKRAELETLAISLEDKELPDGAYWETKRRLDRMNRLFADHWRCVNAAGRPAPTDA